MPEILKKSENENIKSDINKSFEIVLQDGVFDITEFKKLLQQFTNQKEIIYSKFLEENLNTKSKTQNLLNNFINEFSNDTQIDMSMFFSEYIQNSSSQSDIILLDKIKNHPQLKELFFREGIKNTYFNPIYYRAYLQNEPYAKELFLIEAKRNPITTLTLHSDIKSLSFYNEIIDTATKQENIFPLLSDDASREGIMENIDFFKNKPYLLQMFGQMIYHDSSILFRKDRIKKIANYDFAKDIFMILTTDQYANFFIHIKDIKNQKYTKEIILETVNRLTFIDKKRYIISNEIFKKDIFPICGKEALQIIARNASIDIFRNYTFINTLPYKKELLNNASKYLKESENKPYLEIARVINDLHDLNESQRFEILSDFDSNDLYKIIINAREEIFTSTYNGIKDIFLNSIKKENKDIFDIALENNFEGINIFLEARSSYNGFNILFETIKDDEKKKIILDKLFDENIINGNLSNYISIIEIVSNKKINSNLFDYMKEKIKQNIISFPQNNSWQIIARYLYDNYNDQNFKDIDEKFKLKQVNHIDSNELFDNNINTQQYYFYNDDDGKNSYNSFVSKYKTPEWQIKDENSFVVITSNSQNGKKIQIFANKPEFDGSIEGKDGVKDIQDKYTDLKPSIVVHRGHSYHTDATIREIHKDAKMVFLGSCGGFQAVGDVLQNAPNAQIISTKGIGSMTVNDPLFKHINNTILSGKDIVWSEIWEEIGKNLKNNPYFPYYIRPDQNIGVMFFNKYSQITQTK